MPNQPSYNEPIEETYTEWFNPLDVEQYVDVREGDQPRPVRFRVPPKGTKLIPSKYDNVVHRVHNGVIIGGQAPQLIKKGGSDKLDSALDTDHVEKERARIEAEHAAQQKRAAEEAHATASKQAENAEGRIQARKKAEAEQKKPTEG